MEQQQTPHNRSKNIISNKLCIVEHIHRRRCDNKTAHVLGTIVSHLASTTNLILALGKNLINNVVK